ncbi:hypothetical protein [Burkholderia plantarii]|uniref:hypothetical protein n=1 Tax=Burkholderia plantarii TaxID=41899 RepID=UPI0018DB68B8|nr:hypothetical protein [Burkholderia plantarii]MBI0326243.1 hypothetical protein [Burkholderia plantarii]
MIFPIFVISRNSVLLRIPGRFARFAAPNSTMHTKLVRSRRFQDPESDAAIQFFQSGAPRADTAPYQHEAGRTLPRPAPERHAAAPSARA